MTKILTKTVEFCYAHRVQHGNIHGHNGKAVIHLSSVDLNSDGKVINQNDLAWFDQWITDNIDHRLIIDRHDPLYDKLVGKDVPLVPVHVPGIDVVRSHKIDPEFYRDCSPAESEYYSSFLILGISPTAENLSGWLAEIVEVKSKTMNAWVEQVDWWTSSNNCGTTKYHPRRY